MGDLKRRKTLGWIRSLLVFLREQNLLCETGWKSRKKCALCENRVGLWRFVRSSSVEEQADGEHFLTLLPIPVMSQAGVGIFFFFFFTYFTRGKKKKQKPLWFFFLYSVWFAQSPLEMNPVAQEARRLCCRSPHHGVPAALRSNPAAPRAGRCATFPFPGHPARCGVPARRPGKPVYTKGMATGARRPNQLRQEAPRTLSHSPAEAVFEMLINLTLSMSQ